MISSRGILLGREMHWEPKDASRHRNMFLLGGDYTVANMYGFKTLRISFEHFIMFLMDLWSCGRKGSIWSVQIYWVSGFHFFLFLTLTGDCWEVKLGKRASNGSNGPYTCFEFVRTPATGSPGLIGRRSAVQFASWLICFLRRCFMYNHSYWLISKINFLFIYSCYQGDSLFYY